MDFFAFAGGSSRESTRCAREVHTTKSSRSLFGRGLDDFSWCMPFFIPFVGENRLDLAILTYDESRGRDTIHLRSRGFGVLKFVFLNYFGFRIG